MPRKPSINTEQVVIRLSPDVVKDVEGPIAALLSPPGMLMNKTDSFRVTVARGVQAIRDDHAPMPAGAEKLIADMLAALPPAEAAALIVKALDSAALTKLVAALPPAKKGAAPARKPRS